MELANGQTKSMESLSIGDSVRVSPSQFSDVYMFSHRMPEAESSFVQLATQSNHTLLLTHDHYLYVNGRLVAAKEVRVGDMVENKDGEHVRVTAVTETRAHGLYNPHTLQGDIVVGGIRTSTYTTAVAPTLAHSALWPVRMLYSLGYDVIGGLFDQGSDIITALLPDGKIAY